MKHKKLGLLCLSTLTILGLVGCSTGGGSNASSSQEIVSSDETHDSSSISESEATSQSEDTNDWTNEQKKLLKTYCGEVLPYPEYYFDGEITFDVITDSYDEDYSYLKIKDESLTFSMETYFLDLQDAGWNVVYNYNDSAVQTLSGATYVEATKPSSDGENGYDIMYYFSSAYLDNDGNEVSSGNVLLCYNDLDGELTEKSDWTDEDKKVMDSAIAYTLPFIQMGSSYTVSKSSVNSVTISDTYAKDFTWDYLELLKKDGFVVDKNLTEYNGAFVLTKNLENGSSIDILLSYYGGNSFTAYYNAVETDYSSWDNPIIEAAEEATGLTIPSFDIDEGGTYKAYKKSDSYYIYTTDLLTSFDYESYALFTLKDPRLLWEETVSFSCISLTNGEEVYGFMLVITPTAPTSTFVSSWPTEIVDSFMKGDLGISDITLPTLDSVSIPDTGKQVKYVVNDYESNYAYFCKDIKENPTDYFAFDPSEEQIKAKADTLAKENISMSVTVLDKEYQAYEAYENSLYQSKWYGYYDTNSYLIYEDPKGKVSLTFSYDVFPALDYLGPTTITIAKGSGETHQEEFYFNTDEVKLIPGGNKDLAYSCLVKAMLPYDVTYSIEGGDGKITVDEEGFVMVAEDAEVGTTATVYASIQVPGEATPRKISIKITVKKDLNYTPEKAINAVLSLLKEKGYETTAKEEYERYFATVDFGTSMTTEQAKSFVEKNLIPEGFYEFISWRSWNEPVSSTEQSVYFVDNDNESFTCLKYHVYTSDGHTMLLITAE